MTTKQLSGPDAMFLHMELDGFPMLVGGAAIYDPSTSPDGVVRFTDILAMFESRLDRSPIFRRKLAEVPFNLDQPYWVDDPDFDLGYHLRHIGLPRPGDWRQFCNQIAELHSRPLDFGRPLWEAYIIEGLDNVDRFPPACFALYLKVHHCAIDGASGQTFIGAFNDVSPIPETAHPPRPWKPGKAPSNISMLTRAYLNGLRKPGQMLGMGKSMLASRKRVKEGLEAGAFQALGKIPTTRFNGELSAKRVVDATKFDFDSLRRIKNSVAGATINDVVLTIVGGALRKYLQEKAELPEQSLVTGCPVNVRDETEKDREGNMIAVMTTSLCTDVENPMERLQKVHAEALNAKAHLQAQGARAMVDFSESVPSALQAMTMKVLAAARIPEKNVLMNVTVTNVPGSPVQLYLCGAQIVDSFGLGPLTPGMGLFHTVNSLVMNNKGTVTLAFISCRDVMPDPEFYTECIETSYRELCAACLPRKARTAKKKAR